MQVLKLLAFLIIALGVTDAATNVHPNLRHTLQQQPTVNVFVSFQESTRSVLDSTHESAFSSRGEMITALVDRLEAHAAKSQASVAQLVAQEAATEGDATRMEMTSLWITNQLHIRDATASLIEKLVMLPEITEIFEESSQLPPPPPLPSGNVAGNLSLSTSPAGGEPSWAFKQMRIPEVWAMGITGKGVIVGEIDTGARVTHEALKDNWLGGSYGWFDAVNGKSQPYDDAGHGTSTLSNVVGRKGLGVAPDAKWMFCRNCHASNCSFDLVHLKCMQFMTCPTDASGNNKDCSKAPRVINNSWGWWPDHPSFDAALAVWEKVGIFGVFAAGNEGGGGTKCHSIRSPADLPYAFTVGASGPRDTVSPFSSMGYGRSGNVKPDILAPGENIPIATKDSDTSYSRTAGTSVAAPLLTGVVVLMLQANPSLTSKDIRAILTKTAHTEPFMRAPHKCTNAATTGLPNNQFGYGRVDAFRAVNAKAFVASDECEGIEITTCQSKALCTWNEVTSACQTS